MNDLDDPIIASLHKHINAIAECDDGRTVYNLSNFTVSK